MSNHYFLKFKVCYYGWFLLELCNNGKEIFLGDNTGPLVHPVGLIATRNDHASLTDPAIYSQMLDSAQVHRIF